MRSLTRHLPALGLIATGFAASASAPALADPATQLSAGSTAGWTSNAGTDAFGQSSFYLEERLDGSVTRQDGGTALRGSINLSRTDYLSADYERDQSGGISIEGARQISPDSDVGGSASLTLSDEGSALDLGGIGVPITALTRELELEAHARQGIGPADATVSAGWTSVDHSESHFLTLPLPAARLDPNSHLFRLDLRGSYQIIPEWAVSFGAGWRHLTFEGNDAPIYGRAPLDGLRLSLGTSWSAGSGSRLSIEGGGDWLMAAPYAGGPALFPYASAEGSVAVMEGLALTASADAATYLSDPADGVADWALSASLGASWQAMDRLTLAASLTAEQDYSTLTRAWTGTRTGAGAKATYAITDVFSLGTHVSYQRFEDGSGIVEDTRVGADLDVVI